MYWFKHHGSLFYYKSELSDSFSDWMIIQFCFFRQKNIKYHFQFVDFIIHAFSERCAKIRCVVHDANFFAWLCERRWAACIPSLKRLGEIPPAKKKKSELPITSGQENKSDYTRIGIPCRIPNWIFFTFARYLQQIVFHVFLNFGDKKYVFIEFSKKL